MLRLKKENRIIMVLSILSFIFIIVGISIICLNKIDNNIQDLKDSKLLENYEYVQDTISEEIVVDTIEPTTVLGILEIPKIKLKRVFFDKDSENNNVDKNVYLLKESQMPDIDKGNLLLAAHSGNSRVAFFNDLKKLETGDIANINYNGKNYVYELINRYEIDKTGKADIVRDKEKTTLTLITCKQKTKKQYVFIFELKMIEGEESE